MAICYGIKIGLKIFVRKTLRYYIAVPASKLLQNIIYFGLLYAFQHSFMGFVYELSNSRIINGVQSSKNYVFYSFFNFGIKSHQKKLN